MILTTKWDFLGSLRPYLSGLSLVLSVSVKMVVMLRETYASTSFEVNLLLWIMDLTFMVCMPKFGGIIVMGRGPHSVASAFLLFLVNLGGITFILAKYSVESVILLKIRNLKNETLHFELLNRNWKIFNFPSSY